MRKLSQSLGIAVAFTLSGQHLGAEEEQASTRLVYRGAPEPNPPSLTRTETVGRTPLALQATTPEPYSIGDPSDEEQWYVELVNRSRANPQAEIERLLTGPDPDIQAALSFFEVDFALARSQFATLRPAPPLSIHPQLTAAARVHCVDMYENEFQGHVGTDGSSVGERVTRQGYRWNSIAENVFSYAKTVPHGHAGFDIDWGAGEGGMQTPPGHRNTIHNAGFREIGVGVILGTKGPVGPQLVVQEFALKSGAAPFVTGVVYYDLNTNQAYDPGEGIGGVTVSVGGSTQTGVSARSGGYSVPVAGNGTYTVTFDVPGLASVTRVANVVGGENVKLDHVPAYAAPVIEGSAVASRNRNNPYSFTPVGGASGHEWRSIKRRAWTSPEGAESGLGRFEAEVSAAYQPVTTGVSASGSASYHLAHPAPPRSQYLTLKTALQLGTGAEVSFKSRLGSASADQVARVQVSENGGSTWTDIWTQAGKGSPGETTFSAKAASLAAYAGKTVQVRLAYTFVSGQYFAQTSNSAGWFVDDLNVTQAEELTDEQVQATATSSTFVFRPTTLDSYQLQVRPVFGERRLAWGPPLAVTVQEAGPEPATVRLRKLMAAASGWELSFVVESGIAGTFVVEGAGAVQGPWVALPGATVTPQAEAGSYRATWPAAPAAMQQFYRVRSQ